MSSNPPDRKARIRERAYRLWEEDGRPHGRAAEFWERAETLIGMEESAEAGRLPNPLDQTGQRLPAGNGIEEADLQANYGEFPSRLTDQGDRPQAPRTRRRRSKPPPK